ncbi:hypothetical protein [Malikia sp.]|uniref:hypothetical protein n=1 Tax=Malikia sp. TaxID=2070706 RepID=UPI002614E8D1|nr:hypothetical protein [Malikia sp.]MDD2728276.1 hypothetical protein [Malikia sp.]
MLHFKINSEKDSAISCHLKNGVEFRAYIKFKKSNRLFVLFNGAIDLTKSYPYYQRWSWADKFPGSVLYILDPLIKKNNSTLNLAWYLGDKDDDYFQIISNLVQAVSKQLGIDKIYAYGSSGGGFASLMLAKNIKEVYSVAINPQTNVFKYHDNAVSKYFLTAWGFETKDALIKLPREKFDVTNFHERNCLVVQNKLDRFHLDNHFKPFMIANKIPIIEEGIYKGNAISYLLYSHPSGHGPEPLELFPLILETAISINEKL